MVTIASPLQLHSNRVVTPSLQPGTTDLPSPESFLSLVHDCRESRDLSQSQRVHLQICAHGFESLPPLGNYLVPMFVECGSLPVAQQLFHRLNHQNEYSWTSLIQGHVDAGNMELALDMLEPMQAHTILPSTHTFVTLLKACSKLKSLNRGLAVHHSILLSGLESHPFVCNTLLFMFANCGAFSEATHVFDKFKGRDIVSWTALIALYTEQGHADEAVQSLNRMILDGISPNTQTFVCCLNACELMDDIGVVQHLFKEITKQGFEQNVFISNALVHIYSKRGLFLEAVDVFSKLQQKDVITWTTIIMGQSQQGNAEEALSYLERMHGDGVKPNAVTYVSGLRSCGIIQDADRGRKLHAEVVKLGLDGELSLGNTLIDMYAMCSLLEEAEAVFNTMSTRSIDSWNSMIGQLLEHGLGKEAQLYLIVMQAEGIIPPDATTFATSLKACGLLEATLRGFEIHSQVVKIGCDADAFVGSALVGMYAKCHMLAEAQCTFDQLTGCDSIIWTALIAGYAENGLGEEALARLHSMRMDGFSLDSVTLACCLKACCIGGAIHNVHDLHSQIYTLGLEKDFLVMGSLLNAYCKHGMLMDSNVLFKKSSTHHVASWNALIGGHVKHGLADEALLLFEDMQCLEGVLPDVVTYICSLQACGIARTTNQGRAIHREVVKRGYERVSFIGNSLVDMYAKCAELQEAKALVRDVISWTSLMTGYWEQGLGGEALQCIEEMRLEGVSPDAITFVCSLKACISAQSINEGQKLHAEVVKEGFEEDPVIASNLADLYSLCDKDLEAEDVSQTEVL
ncbi:hypothetical protein GOP47_0003454 [Adiantum capillus-veneris]|uniref:Pentatricopeptide repeat-containing protein n=1 Tax=Adiantum capillus-veneris TaxID=13818 RepID=A0A9D4ZRV6_ADICA|nr:hypothetical protein GOP47_0003454 [Adiantum capillus-veneris]